ncbi:hypothetical protein HY468_00495 [Candidatus Roizmanbacteria bacterium]|nr:hypothetical protein [Candidatus Roizmanbacteria bacterium]
MEQYQQIVNGENVHAFRANFYDANTLQVQAGTTGERGGDTGHGGRTFFSLKDLGGTDISITTGEDGTSLEVSLGGDAELRTITSALQFILDALATNPDNLEAVEALQMKYPSE